MGKPWTVRLHRDNEWEEWQVVVRKPSGIIDEGKTYYTLDGSSSGREDAVTTMPHILKGLKTQFGSGNVVLLKGRLTPAEFESLGKEV